MYGKKNSSENLKQGIQPRPEGGEEDLAQVRVLQLSLPLIKKDYGLQGYDKVNWDHPLLHLHWGERGE